MYVGARVFIEIDPETEFLLDDYSAKIVKTILIEANRAFRRLFSPKRNPRKPKEICISPLLRDGKPVYPHTFKKGAEIKPVRIAGNYEFYIGTSVRYWSEIEQAINAVSDRRVAFRGRTLKVRVNKVSIERVYPSPSAQLRERYKMVFVGPVYFRDPFDASDKYKAVLPTPENLFSIQLKLLRYTQRYSLQTIVETLRRYIKMPPTVYHFMRPVWFAYRINGRQRRILGVTGSLQLYVKTQGMPPATGRMILDLLTLAYVIGIGSARAAGFGYIELVSY